MNSIMSTLYLAAELACACFVGMVVAVVIVCAVESARQETETETNAAWEPLPVAVVILERPHYTYLRCYSDGEATWMLHSGRQIYNVN